MGLTDDSLPTAINEPLLMEPSEIILDNTEDIPITDISTDLQDLQTDKVQIDENISSVYNPSPSTQDALEIDGNSDSDNEEKELEKSETENYSFRDCNKRKVRFQNFA
jgi:hypothetical protein